MYRTMAAISLGHHVTKGIGTAAVVIFIVALLYLAFGGNDNGGGK